MDQLIGVMTSLNSRVGELEAKSRPPSPFLSQPGTQPATVPGQSAVQPVATDNKRWRPEEVGTFDGTGDVMAFIDRIKIVAANKSVRLVQTNITTVLKETAFNWYRYELEEHVKLGLNTSTTIEPWCQALAIRFQPNHRDLMTQLEAAQYTRKEVANKKDATAFI